jgi:dihydrofolate reductase
MSEVIPYIASTIDGFIAAEDGSVAFLDPYNTEDYGFTEFFAGIDAVIMGRKTYEHG